MRSALVRLLILAAIAGVVIAFVRRSRAPAEAPAVTPTWPPLREPDPTTPTVTATATVTAEPWAPPVERGCPDGYPVKVKLASGIYHLPGGLAYERTTPDRCYATAEQAEADGFRPAKR